MSRTHVKRHRKNKILFNLFHLFSCCTSSADEVEVGTKLPELTHSGIQCDIVTEKVIIQQNDLESNLLRCHALLDINQLDEEKTQSFNKDMKSSLEKLDSLITALNSIHEIYTKRTEPLQSFEHINDLCPESSQTSELTHINIYKRTYGDVLQKSDCLTMFDNSSLPVMLRRPDFSNYNSEHSDNNIRLPLAVNFGHFSTTFLDNLTTIKTDIECLKNVFSNIKGILISDDNAYVAFACGGLKSYFKGTDRWLCKSEDFNVAKMSVANFCKFYKLGQTYVKKCRKRRSARYRIKN